MRAPKQISAKLTEIDMPYTDHEPLAPDPAEAFWKTQAMPWMRDGGFIRPEYAYTNGFKDGAYALGELAWNLLRAGEIGELTVLLAAYNVHKAQPVKGWRHEPTR